MRRLQWTLLLLATGLALSVALLASRALEGVAFEKAARHETVATRVFEEMERELSRFLEQEEARPFESWSPGTSDALAGNDFVVGYFQVDPDGRMRDRENRAGAGQRAAKNQPELDAIVGRVWEQEDRDVAEGKEDEPRPVAQRPAPGKTKRVTTKKSAGAKDAAVGGETQRYEDLAIDSKAEEQESEANAYRVLQAFNARSADRADRQRKVDIAKSRSSARDYAAAPTRPASPPLLARKAPASLPQPDPARRARPAPSSAGLVSDGESSETVAERIAPQAMARRAAAEPMEEAGTLAREEPVTPAEVADSIEPEAMEKGFAQSSTVDPLGIAQSGRRLQREQLEGDDAIERRAKEFFDAEATAALDPLIGRPSGPDHLLLYRTVVVDARGYRQGLVVDRARLGSWLRQRVLAAAGELANSSAFWFFGSGQPVRYAAATDWLAYEHRFAEPFDAFSVVLALAPLPGVATTSTIYALVALVLGVATLGLFAVYRMAFVTLRYAERRNNFVSAVSHELKTPLTAIRMYGEMLRDGVADDEAKRQSYYETITDESERLSRLINNVLEFSKIERGGAESALMVGAMGPVLDEAIRTLRPHAEREGFALRAEIEENLPALRFDRDAVVQLLFNLVDNALKYARQAEQKEVVVTCRRAGSGVRLAVRDFGPGVARPHLSKVFEPFYRGENEMTRSSRGTGIGLALVKDLAERMGAAASAANAQGGGFEISIQFPAAA